MSTNRILLLICAFLASELTFAWGDTGHKVICQIAYEQLDATARTEVERLIELDPDFESFAESCVFADTPERIRMFDHFMNVPRSYRAITTYECPMADSCVMTAIQTDVAVLVDPAADDAERLLALKLLSHWVADIHQPMHVSFQDDRGANWVEAVVKDLEVNLHGVWDSWIIAHNLGDDYRRIATKLGTAISAEQRAAWRYDSPIEWANESYQITISPDVAYCTHKQGACWHEADNMLLDDGEPRRRIAIDADYLKRHRDVVAQRLQQAGVRLAAMLNRLFR